MDGMDKLIIAGIIFALIGVIECIVSKKKGTSHKFRRCPSDGSIWSYYGGLRNIACSNNFIDEISNIVIFEFE